MWYVNNTLINIIVTDCVIHQFIIVLIKNIWIQILWTSIFKILYILASYDCFLFEKKYITFIPTILDHNLW